MALSARTSISRAGKLAAVLRESQYRRALRYGVAASVEHEAIPLPEDFRTVIDAGANRGQFALFAARRFPRAALLCSSRFKVPRRKLRRALGYMPLLSVFDVALGAHSGEAVFHVSAADDSSSLLPIGGRQQDAFPGTEERTTIVVAVRRLDEAVTPADLNAPVLLKIDVQGGELGVLQGADDILGRIDAVLVEVSFVELYAGQALVDQVWGFLNAKGFTCRGVWSVAYGAGKECLQGDLLFARSGFEPLAKSGQPAPGRHRINHLR